MSFFKKSLIILTLLSPLYTQAVSLNPESLRVYENNPLVEDSPELMQKRMAFVNAKEAIKKGDVTTALTLQKQYLKDYPLSIYIDYWYLAKDPSLSKYPQVKKFIKAKNQTELGAYLKNIYIDYLSSQGQYKKVLELFGNKKPYADSPNLNRNELKRQCRFYEASWYTSRADVASVAFATSLYQRMNSYPDECTALMVLWQQKGYLTNKTVMEKFEKAYISKRYESLTRSLANSLQNSKFALRVDTLMGLYDNPKIVLDKILPRNVEGRRAAVLAYKRYASLNSNEAAENFAKFSKIYKPSATEILEIKQIIANNFLGRLSDPKQIAWVDKNLPAVGWTDNLKEMRARRAIWYSEWKNLYAIIDYLPASLKKEINWQYWKGRSALEIGKTSQGERILKKVATDRSFFGFLAAQALDRKLPFNHKKLSKSVRFPEAVAKNKAVRRFFELNALGDSNASLEWREIAKTASDDEALLMADWALRNGHVNYAISSIAIGKRWDALSYRFPIAYLDLYRKYARAQNVSLSFLYGISRQESMMNPVVKSPAGAIGLMQLMPATAHHVSKKNNWAYKGVSELVYPENNIRLGSAYVKDMLDKFDNNRILAAVAYNAGPSRVLRWASKDGKFRDSAMYIENIPFNETRKYVQNVLLYDAIYNKLLTGKEGVLLSSNELDYNY